MRKQTMLFPIFLAALLASLLNGCSLSSQAVAQARQAGPGVLKPRIPTIINTDGDVSMSEQLNRIYWNPHCVGLTKAYWKVTFNNEAEISLRTAANDAGHVAAGAWWTMSFGSKQKLQLYASKPLSVQASFRANVLVAKCVTGHEWLRIALACAIQRADGSVVYTEMDFYDSPRVLTCSSGNIRSGGNVIYRGGDVIEYKMAQAGLAKWANYLFDLTEYVNQGWLLKPGDMLESVYVVVEVIGQTTVTVRVDDLWITLLG
jgi:hypothetical protein